MLKQIITSITFILVSSVSYGAESLYQLSQRIDNIDNSVTLNQEGYSNLKNQIIREQIGKNNKTELWFLPIKEIPIVDIHMIVGGGSALDIKGKEGTAELVAHMISTGSERYNEEQISKELAILGSTYTITVDNDKTIIRIRSTNNIETITKTIDIISNFIINPTFDDKILERDKKIILQQLQQAEINPAYQVSIKSQQLNYPNHPYGNQKTIKSINNITKKDLIDYYNTYYTDDNTEINVVGEISSDLASYFADSLLYFKSNSDFNKVKYKEFLNKHTLYNTTTTALITMNTSQSHINFSMLGVKKGDDQFFPLFVGNYILGGGSFESMLMKEIRVKNGLAYSAYSTFNTSQDKGLFKINMQTKTESTEEAIKKTKEVINNFINGQFTEADLLNAKKAIIISNSLTLSSNKDIIEILNTMNYYNLNFEYLENFAKNIKNVKKQDIVKSFNNIIDLKKLNLIYITTTVN